MSDKEVRHIKEVDFSDLKLPIVAVYDHPVDYPEHIVARVFDADKPTDVVMLRHTVEEIQEEMQKTGLMWFVRGAGDEPHLLGCWA